MIRDAHARHVVRALTKCVAIKTAPPDVDLGIVNFNARGTLGKNGGSDAEPLDKMGDEVVLGFMG